MGPWYPNRAASYPWPAIARELARKSYVTRSGRPWTLWNVRSAYATVKRKQRLLDDSCFEKVNIRLSN